jgi:hypothetical protein
VVCKEAELPECRLILLNSSKKMCKLSENLML